MRLSTVQVPKRSLGSRGTCSQAFCKSIDETLPCKGLRTPLINVKAPKRSFASRANGAHRGTAEQIGERARQRQQGRVWSLVIGGTAFAGFIIVALNTFQENLMFYITPTQALEKFGQEPSKKRFRLGGLVLEGSVRKFVNSMEMEFVITDLETDILVRYRGALPDLFREGHSIVAEGFLKPLDLPPSSTPEPAQDLQAQDTAGQAAIRMNASHEPEQGKQGQGGTAGRATSGPTSAAAGSSELSKLGTQLPGQPKAYPFQGPDGGGGLRAGFSSPSEAVDEVASGKEDVSKKARGMGLMFTAVEVLAKHDEKYMPKEVAAVIAVNKAKQEAEEAAQAGLILQQNTSTSTSSSSTSSSSSPMGMGKKEGKKKQNSVGRTPVESQAYEVPS